MQPQNTHKPVRQTLSPLPSWNELRDRSRRLCLAWSDWAFPSADNPQAARVTAPIDMSPADREDYYRRTSHFFGFAYVGNESQRSSTVERQAVGSLR